MEHIQAVWGYIVAGIGIITALWGFRKVLKEIQDSIKQPITNIEANIHTMNDKIDVQDEAIKSILRKDILNLSEKYIKQGYITINQKKTLFELYKSYKDEGGNTFIDALIDDINELPVKPEEEKSE